MRIQIERYGAYQFTYGFDTDKCRAVTLSWKEKQYANGRLPPNYPVPAIHHVIEYDYSIRDAQHNGLWYAYKHAIGLGMWESVPQPHPILKGYRLSEYW